MKKQVYLFLVLFIISFSVNAQVMPQGFLVGPSGMIGSQLWMSKNLDVTTFNDGTAIPNFTSATGWRNLTTAAMCSYNFNPANDAVYGKLYNWYAVVDSRGVCPVNWHVPSSAEFATLNSFIGSDGGSLKEAGLTHWNSPNTGASNKYNFTALATGYMGTLSPSGLGNVTYFWTVTSNATDNTRAYTRSLSKDNALFVESNLNDKIGGFSVRCIHD